MSGLFLRLTANNLEIQRSERNRTRLVIQFLAGISPDRNAYRKPGRRTGFTNSLVLPRCLTLRQSGRMLENYIGHVYRFEDATEKLDLHVDFPILTQRDAPTELLM